MEHIRSKIDVLLQPQTEEYIQTLQDVIDDQLEHLKELGQRSQDELIGWYNTAFNTNIGSVDQSKIVRLSDHISRN